MVGAPGRILEGEGGGISKAIIGGKGLGCDHLTLERFGAIDVVELGMSLTFALQHLRQELNRKGN